MKLKLPFVAVLAAMLFGSFSVWARTDSQTNSPATMDSVTNSTSWHTIKKMPRNDLPKIHFYNKLNPVWWLKNQDDPKPPDWYKPNDKRRKLKWSFRNPMHNFNFYVIGVADKKFSRSGRFPEQNSDPRGGWDFEFSRYKIFWFPFVSYHRPKFDFYFGWRERGNFGIKFNVNPDRHKTKA